jgi:hypothetical protein
MNVNFWSKNTLNWHYWDLVIPVSTLWTETITVKYKSEKSFTTNTEANYWNLKFSANGPTNTYYVNSSLVRNIKIIVFFVVFKHFLRYRNGESRHPGRLPLYSPHTVEMAFDCLSSSFPQRSRRRERTQYIMNNYLITRETDTAPRASTLIHINDCIFNAATKRQRCLLRPTRTLPLSWLNVRCDSRWVRPADEEGQNRKTQQNLFLSSLSVTVGFSVYFCFLA